MFAKKPTAKVYAQAKKHQAMRYARVVQDTMALQNVLASGYAVSFGFTVYTRSRRASARTGSMPMPQPDEKVLGGHAVVAVGYKPIKGQLYFECRNSWGTSWGDHGYFWMPAAYITSPSLASDFWVIQQVE